MSNAICCKKIKLSTCAYVSIDMALRVAIAQSKERLKYMPLGDDNAAGRNYEVQQLNNLLLAQKEFTA